MKSNKQRRREIKQRRLRQAKKNMALDTTIRVRPLPKGAVEASAEALAHNNTYDLLPKYYLDIPFRCCDCGSEEVWTAKQQKWWYEIIKANINSQAVRCRRCRRTLREAKAAQRAHMRECSEQPPHPNEAFFRKRYR